MNEIFILIGKTLFYSFFVGLGLFISLWFIILTSMALDEMKSKHKKKKEETNA